jgi:hypothetical protein
MTEQYHQKDRVSTVSPKNINPLLKVIWAELGLDWDIYYEFLVEIKAAITAGDNLATIIDQIEPLIQTRSCQVAHQGVLFLLREMEVRRHAKGKTITNKLSPLFTSTCHKSIYPQPYCSS